MIAQLRNRGPHLDCYRGMVTLHDDGRITWLDTGDAVSEQHGDFLAVVSRVQYPYATPDSIAISIGVKEPRP